MNIMAKATWEGAVLAESDKTWEYGDRRRRRHHFRSDNGRLHKQNLVRGRRTISGLAGWTIRPSAQR
jgi:hypothetical protein